MQTATNPLTGEKLVLQNGQWVPAGSAAPQQGGAFTVGTPRPEKPKDPPSGYTGDTSGLSPIPGGPADPYRPGGELDPNKPAKQPKDPQIDANERKGAGFAKRAIGAYINYRSHGQGPRSLIGQTLKDEAPNILGILPDFVGNSSERRLSDQAELEFISAQLRQDSGATIPPEEIKAQRPTWFPSPGDTDPKVLTNYDEARKRAIEGLIAAAGDQVKQDPELQRLIQEFQRVSATPFVTPTAPSGNGDIGFNTPDQPKNPLSPDQQQAYDLFFKMNPNATPEQLQAFGQSLGINVENAQAIIEARNKGAGVQPGSEAVSGLTPEQQAEVARRVQSGGGTGAAVVGATDAATLGFSDEMAAGGDAFMGALSGEGSIGDLYNQNIGVERAMKEQFGNEHPFLYTGGQIAGGAAIPAGVGGGVGRLAAVGAAQGGAYGLGSGEGGLTSRLPTAATGALLGAGIGAGLGAVSPVAENALLRFANRPSRSERVAEVAQARPIIEAGERQGIPIRQPDARPSTRADFAALEASETGNPIVTRALRSDKEAVQERVRDVGGRGIPLDDFDMGQRVQETGRNYLAKTKQQANGLYSRAENLAGNASSEADAAIGTIDNHIADLKATGERTNAGAIKYLEDLKADLSGGASIQKLRNIRKNMRGQISERSLTATDTERRVGEVLDALGGDIEKALPASARQAFRSADDFYRERMNFKTQVIERFVGPRNNPISPEQAASRFNNFMRSKDFGRFKRMMDEMEPGDRQDIAATVAENLGLARNGEFSLAALSTNIDKMGPRAIKELFGEDGAKAIADLRIIARAKADTAGGLNNSRTAVVNNRNGLRDVMFGIFGGGLAGAPGAVGGFLARGVLEKMGNARAARMLLNPDFTKWLRNTPQSASPKVINEHFARLAKVATRDAVFAADVKALQQLLAESFSRAPIRAAASDKENDGRPKPPGQ